MHSDLGFFQAGAVYSSPHARGTLWKMLHRATVLGCTENIVKIKLDVKYSKCGAWSWQFNLTLCAHYRGWDWGGLCLNIIRKWRRVIREFCECGYFADRKCSFVSLTSETSSLCCKCSWKCEFRKSDRQILLCCIFISRIECLWITRYLVLEVTNTKTQKLGLFWKCW